jgi:hypothetical protein
MIKISRVAEERRPADETSFVRAGPTGASGWSSGHLGPKRPQDFRLITLNFIFPFHISEIGKDTAINIKNVTVDKVTCL